MTYTSEILINLPLKEVLNKLRNYDNMKYWQRGLESFEHLSGELGTVGAKMKLNYNFYGRKICLIETITHSDLPKEYHVYYDSEGIHNIHKNCFKEINSELTKWTFESESIPISFSMSLKTLLMPSLYKSETLKYLDDFKNFAEKGVSVIEYA